MRRSLFVFALFLLVAASGHDAQARMYFGQRDSLHHLQDLDLKSPGGEALYLGYMTSMNSFVLPYSVSDAGYVLGIKGESDKFYKLPKERLTQLQQAGALPDPLPRYQLKLLDYLFGYSLWLALVLIVILAPFMRKREPTPYRATGSA
jgi:hypothetical protein